MNSEKVLAFEEIKERLRTFCSSSIAKEMALSLQIMNDVANIEESLLETAEAIQSLERESEQPLGGTRDIRTALSKSKKDIALSHDELWDVYTSLSAYKRIKKFFLEKYMYYPQLSLWAQDISFDEGLEGKFESIFDKKGNLLDTASPKLNQLRTLIFNTKERIKRELQDLLHDKETQKYLQEAIVTQRNDRYVIPVKQEYRYSIDGIIHDKSATGATLYIEPMRMVRLNNDLQEAIMEEEREIQKIYRELSQRIKKDSARLRDACNRVSHIEFVYGKGEFALSYKGHPAIINKGRIVDLRNGRHPLLNPDMVVPTNIMLGKEYAILLITGSNTGGKTVALKTLGLLCMMNQSGLCVPADQGTELPVFRNIYADIGDEQSISESLSTFSAHMTQISRIMNEVESNDLVLLDELGSGTDPEEGSALAVAILDQFRTLGPLMMVTTHYNELKNYAYNTEGVENGHVEFDEVTLKPTYRLHIGVAGSSHALSIAERLGLPNSVIEHARNLKDGAQSGDMEKLLNQLNEQVRMADERERKLKTDLDRAQTLRREAERERRNVEERKKAILDKAKQDADLMKRNLRIESEQIIKSLKEQFSQKDSQKRAEGIQKARKDASQLPIPKGYEQKREAVNETSLKVGDMVFLTNLQAMGSILDIQGKRVKVDVNGLTATVKTSDIAEVTKEERQQIKRDEKRREEPLKRRTKSGSAVQRQQSASTEINILGNTVDEAVIKVGHFIDQALLAGISPVKIIHGKGTGALRAGVQDYLRSLSVVNHFELAGFDDGGAGATIVYLK